MRTQTAPRFLLTLLLALAIWLAAAVWGRAYLSPSAQGKSLGAGLPLLPNWTFDDRTQIGASMGASVSTAGDVNGDGYDDVLVGAPKFTLAIEVEGAALVFYGGAAGLSSLPDWQAGGGLKGARFGGAVSDAGDINGDGFDDILVGANRFNLGEPEEGAAFAFYGSDHGLSAAPDWQIQSNQKEAQYGAALSGAGDVNGDGWQDVVIGAPLYDQTLQNEGAAFIYYGSESGLATDPGCTMLGGEAGTLFGAAVAGAGDVNNDGWDDVIVGAPQYLDEGMAQIFYGSAAGLQCNAGSTVTTEFIGAEFGAAVAGAGDVNADGYADVIVGAPYTKDLLDQQVGAAYLYLGSATGLSLTPAWQAQSKQVYSLFGSAVGGAQDVNQDGFDDLLVGAPQFSGDQDGEGAVFLYFGGFQPASAYPSWTGYGNKADTSFGASIHTAGDVNQDGRPDLIVGAPEYKLDTLIVGRSMAYYASITPNKVFLPYLSN